jgi:hypothetical protein
MYMHGLRRQLCQRGTSLRGRRSISSIRIQSGRRCRRTEARESAPRPSLMKLFELPSQDRAVELRAAQQMLMHFARLKSSQPI